MGCFDCIFFGALLFSFWAKSEELLKEYIPYWSYITMLYIGGNVAQDFASNIGIKK